MQYARIIDGAVAQFPYPLTQLRTDFPNTSFPQPYELADLADFGLAAVAPTEPGAFNALTHKAVELTPVLIDATWTQQWAIEPLSGPEFAQKVADIQAAVVVATQARLDFFARTRSYDNILSACTYASSAVPKFAAEGQYAVNARDATWATLYQFMLDVQAGTAPMPSGFADVEPLLPALVWPA